MNVVYILMNASAPTTGWLNKLRIIKLGERMKH